MPTASALIVLLSFSMRYINICIVAAFAPFIPYAFPRNPWPNTWPLRFMFCFLKSIGHFAAEGDGQTVAELSGCKVLRQQKHHLGDGRLKCKVMT